MTLETERTRSCTGADFQHWLVHLPSQQAPLLLNLPPDLVSSAAWRMFVMGRVKYL